MNHDVMHRVKNMSEGWRFAPIKKFQFVFVATQLLRRGAIVFLENFPHPHIKRGYIERFSD